MPPFLGKLTSEPAINEYYSNKKILITGGRGYLGSCLSESLSNTGALIYLLDHSASTWLPTNSNNIRLISADICDIESYRNVLKEVDVIYHLAALEYDRSGFDLVRDYSTNAKAVHDLVEACVSDNVRPIIIFSSSTNIFGLQDSSPVSEKNRDNPPSFWSAHKLLAENYITIYSAKYNFQTMILRLPNVFGPCARSSLFSQSAINRMILDSIYDGIINLYGNAECLRDQIFITDAIMAFLYAPMSINKSKSNICLLGSRVGYTYRSIAEIILDAIRELTGKEVIIMYHDDKYDEPIDKRDFLVDIDYFSCLTGWVPQKDLKSSIYETILFILSKGDQIWNKSD